MATPQTPGTPKRVTVRRDPSTLGPNDVIFAPVQLRNIHAQFVAAAAAKQTKSRAEYMRDVILAAAAHELGHPVPAAEPFAKGGGGGFRDPDLEGLTAEQIAEMRAAQKTAMAEAAKVARLATKQAILAKLRGASGAVKDVAIPPPSATSKAGVRKR